MTPPSEDELAEFSHLVAELEQRLEQSFAAHDLIIARQAANEQENARLRAGLTAAREVREPLAAIHDLARLATELTGKLNDALQPAALDDKTRAEVDELTRLLTGSLGKLVQHGDSADTILENLLLYSHEGPGDPWAADIDALRQEFPSEVSSGEDTSSQRSPDERLPDQDPPDGALARKEQG